MTIHPGAAALQRHALGESQGDERLQLEDHLRTCPACTRVIADERQLDDWIVATSAPPSPAAPRAAFERLWDAVDVAEPEAVVAPRIGVRPRRAGAWRWVAAAALLALAVVIGRPWRVAEPDSGADDPHEVVLTEDALPQRPQLVWASAPSTPDAARLEQVRAALAEALSEADEALPFAEADFVAVCERAFAPLRAEGWAVSQLVRGLALGRDADLSHAALRYALADPATSSIVAQALARRESVEAALALMESRELALEHHPELLRALQKLLLVGTDRALSSTQRTAAELLARDAAGASALDLVLDRTLDRAHGRAGGDSVSARTGPGPSTRLQELLALVPAETAVPVLGRLAARQDQAGRAAALFAERLAADPEGTQRALSSALAAGAEAGPSAARLTAPLLDWVVEHELVALGPGLVVAADVLGNEESEPYLQAAARLGDRGALARLFARWRDTFDAERSTSLLTVLVEVLERDEASRGWLGGDVGLASAEALVQLAGHCAPAIRADLLLPYLWSAGPSLDPGGYTTPVLTAVARWGDEEHGRRLVGHLALQPPADRRVAALAWMTAARLTPDHALDAWNALGGRASTLQSALRTAGSRWPSRADRPSAALLSDVERALRRDLGLDPMSGAAGSSALPIHRLSRFQEELP